MYYVCKETLDVSESMEDLHLLGLDNFCSFFDDRNIISYYLLSKETTNPFLHNVIYPFNKTLTVHHISVD